MTDFRCDHRIQLQVSKDQIDVLGHVNNCEYLKWFEQVAWSHCNAIGMDWQTWQDMGYAWVARHTELDYFYPAFEGEHLIIKTCILDNDGKISMNRGYQICRESDGMVLVSGFTKWVCINLKTGKASRMPQAFHEAFSNPEEESMDS